MKSSIRTDEYVNNIDYRVNLPEPIVYGRGAKMNGGVSSRTTMKKEGTCHRELRHDNAEKEVNKTIEQAD